MAERRKILRRKAGLTDEPSDQRKAWHSASLLSGRFTLASFHMQVPKFRFVVLEGRDVGERDVSLACLCKFNSALASASVPGAVRSQLRVRASVLRELCEQDAQQGGDEGEWKFQLVTVH